MTPQVKRTLQDALRALPAHPTGREATVGWAGPPSVPETKGKQKARYIKVNAGKSHSRLNTCVSHQAGALALKC